MHIHAYTYAYTHTHIHIYMPSSEWKTPHKDQKYLLQFSLELSDALILANKVNLSSSRGRPQNEEVWRYLPWVKSLLKHCLLPMFVLIKLNIGQALLPTKIDADYAV